MAKRSTSAQQSKNILKNKIFLQDKKSFEQLDYLISLLTYAYYKIVCT
jgi:hypothetical protein